MLANSIGIYRGAKNIGDFFNKESFLNYDDFKNEDELIKRIIELDNDDEKYSNLINQCFFEREKIPQRILNIDKNLERFLLKVVG